METVHVIDTRVREIRRWLDTSHVFDTYVREIRAVALEGQFPTHVFGKYDRLFETDHVFEARVREMRPTI